MNIAIIGKGTSSLITAMICLLRGHNVTIYYDPDKEHIAVGESTTPQFANLIRSCFGVCIHDLVDKNLASFKTGIKFINWGNGKSFKHPFANNALAFHFSTYELNPFISDLLEKHSVKFIPERIDSHSYENGKVNVNNTTYDFLISCVGWDEDKNYKKPFIETVNSGITYTENFVDIDSNYTIHRATEDGWQFGLPFPERNITRCGYLFDRNIISSDKVKEKLKNKNLENSYEWNPRYCKSLIQNENLAFNGNRLFFFEPLQALSLYYTFRFADLICNYLDNRSDGRIFTRVNSNYLYEIYLYQQTIAWHYRFGSSYDTEYWKNIVKKSNEFLHSIPSGDLDIFMNLLENDKKFKDTDFSTIGIFTWKDMDYIISGMNAN